MIKGTRWRQVMRRCAGEIHREIKVTISPAPNPQKWVFIVGCYNSGTTLLRKILGSDPQISALPAEGQYLTDQLRSDDEIGLPRMWVEREDLYRLDENCSGPDVVRIMKEWSSRLDRSKPLFLDQTPAHSARTRWLQAHFVPAYFIAVVRNGYAVAEGIRRKAKPIHRKDGWPISMAAYQWSRSNDILIQDAEKLQNIIWVRYEDIVDDPEKELYKIYNFLGLSIANMPNVTAAWSVHERLEKIHNLNLESMERLSRADINTINEVASETLRYFNYEVLDPENYT